MKTRGMLLALLVKQMNIKIRASMNAKKWKCPSCGAVLKASMLRCVACDIPKPMGSGESFIKDETEKTGSGVDSVVIVDDSDVRDIRTWKLNPN